MQERAARPDITRRLREWQGGNAEALSRLEALDPQQGRVVELRFFGGLTIEETAVVMRSSSAIKREWAVARAWLHRELSGEAASPPPGEVD